MDSETIGPLTLRVEREHWLLITPFRISGYTFDAVQVILVTLGKDGEVGKGEAAGVYYKGDDLASMIAQIERVRAQIEAGISRKSLQELLPPGGARNALDCALWDLEAKLAAQPAWRLAGLDTPQPLLTTFTCGAETPETMARTALAYPNARAIKLKLTGDPIDADRIRAVREALPAAWLGVDANQGFTRPFLEQLMPVMVQAGVALIEQPFPIGQESWLDGLRSPIPVAADESVQKLADLPALVDRFNVINIKLDKCGGLTEGLAMARAARERGLQAMVGNMMGTSLAMAPAFLVGQLCEVVDLDGPLFIKVDRPVTVQYRGGSITCPADLWGGSQASGA